MAVQTIIEEPEEMAGNLESWPLADVLMWLHRARRSALVRVGSGLVRGKIYVRYGHVFRCDWGQASVVGSLRESSLQAAERAAHILDECRIFFSSVP